MAQAASAQAADRPSRASPGATPWQVANVRFQLFGSEDARRLSVKEISRSETFDRLTGYRLEFGLYDPDLGPLDERDVCRKCGLGYWECAGHFGHIELPSTVIHPMLFDIVYKLLRCKCFYCHRFSVRADYRRLVRLQFRALASGNCSLADSLANLHASFHHEAREAGASKRKAEANGEANGGVELDEELVMEAEAAFKTDAGCVEQLQEAYDAAMAGADPSNATAASLTTSAVHSKRHELIRATMQLLIGRGKGKCPHCGCKRPSVLHKYRADVYIASSRVGYTESPLLRSGRLATNVDSIIDSIMEESTQLGHNATMADIAAEMADEDELEETLPVGGGGGGGHESRVLTPMVIRDHMRCLWEQEWEILGSLFPSLMGIKSQRFPTDALFLEAMLVPPPVCRPPGRAAADSPLIEHPETSNLSNVLRKAIDLTAIVRDTEFETAQPMKWLANHVHCTIALQRAVNACYDSALSEAGSAAAPGFKQRLEKKQGLLRMHMMGKRVNYACRSVISPDPLMRVDEVGIPTVFARRLTFPEEVTQFNIHQLRRLVVNGPDLHPGANAVVRPNGQVVNLPAASRKTRKAIAGDLRPSQGKVGPWTVQRHLVDEDLLIMNRQPTLHRPSMQGHRVRVLPNPSSGQPLRTIRLHYSACKAYNADFDGDEMNGHCVQSHAAKAEVQCLMRAPNNYLAPKDGSPLGGLIQDHVISAVKLTWQNRFLSAEDYFQLVWHGLSGYERLGRSIRTLPPAVCCLGANGALTKLWTGKQVFSTLFINLVPDGCQLPNIQLAGRRMKAELWAGKGDPVSLSMSDVDLVVRDGQLLTGLLDKAHIGSSAYGLVHAFHELYGPQPAADLLTGITRISNHGLQSVGFTLGLKDLIVQAGADAKRRSVFKKVEREGVKAARAGMGIQPELLTPAALRRELHAAHFDRDIRRQVELDATVSSRVKSLQDRICEEIMPGRLLVPFPHNNLQLMIHSGAKGSQVNAQQMSVALGQIEIEGRRMAPMLSGRTLPSFRPYDTNPRAGGFCAARFLTGLPPQELFFHTMAGRDGLIDTAVKTSRSGYLQRSLVKHLEALSVQYDMTVRNGDSSIVQFLYGGDGLEVMRTPFLQAGRLGLFADNCQLLQAQAAEDKVGDVAEADDELRRKWRRLNRQLARCEDPKRRRSATLRDGVEYARRQLQPDTILSASLPHLHCGSVSEALHSLVCGYAAERFADCAEERRSFQQLMWRRCQRALAPPGECVGLLASQSIGEPSTQMTLNTFHFAGRGEVNVTLGIPRLREILMTGSENIKTPVMQLPVRLEVNDCPVLTAKLESLAKRWNRIVLSDLLKEISVSYHHLDRRLRISFKFKRRSEYKDRTLLKPPAVLRYIEKKFFVQLAKEVSARVREKVSENVLRALSNAGADMLGDARRGGGDGDDDGGGGGGGGDEGGDDAWNENDGAEAGRRAAGDEFREFDAEDAERSELIRDGTQLSDDDEEAGEFADAAEVNVKGEPSLEPRRVINVAESEEEEDAVGASAGVRIGGNAGGDASVTLEARERAEAVIALHPAFVAYEFDAKKCRSCHLTVDCQDLESKLDVGGLVAEMVGSAVVHKMPLVQRATIDKSKRQWQLKVEGVNFNLVRPHSELLDLDAAYTNNIRTMQKTYGIEAAASCIIKEVKDVFKHYGIVVDPRHLSLVSDYMTCSGSYLAFSRHGLFTQPSSLQRMSFETPSTVLKETVLHAVCDDMRSPSSCIMVGQPPATCGTAQFDLLQSLPLLSKRKRDIKFVRVKSE